jgi:hypothetical protein
MPGLLDQNPTLQDFAFKILTYENEHNIIHPLATCDEVEHDIMLPIHRGIEEKCILCSISNLNLFPRTTTQTYPMGCIYSVSFPPIVCAFASLTSSAIDRSRTRSNLP